MYSELASDSLNAELISKHTPMQITTSLLILNKLIQKIQLPIVIKSLDECAPLLWVALVEGLLKTRITSITRNYPQDPIQRLKSKYHNTYSMLFFLEETLKVDLSHLRVELLIQGDEKIVCNLIEVLMQLGKAIDKRDGVEDELDSFEGISEIEVNDGLSLVSDMSYTSFEEDSDNNEIQMSSKSTQNRPTRRKLDVLSMIEDEDVNEYFAMQESKSAQSTHSFQSNVSSKENTEMKTKEDKKTDVLQSLKRKRATLEQELKNTNQKIHSIHSHPESTHDTENKSSAPENDFKRLKTMLEATLNKPVSERIQSHFNDKQVSSWKRALDDKVWRRKVSTMKKIASTDQRPSKTLEIEQEKDLKRDLVRGDNEEGRIALIELKEREQRVKKMQNRQTGLEKEKENVEKRNVNKQERIMAQVYDDYLKKQRNDIIEKRAIARDIEKSVKIQMNRQRTQKDLFYLDQIKMYKNELDEAQKEQENTIKGINLDTKLRMQEEKKRLKRDILGAKDKTVCKDNFRVDEDVEKLIGSIKVDIRRPAKRMAKEIRMAPK